MAMSDEERKRRKREYQKAYSQSEKGKEYYKEYFKRYRPILKADWPRDTLRSIKDRCKTRNYEFDLSIEDLSVPDVCPVLGIPVIQGYINRDYRPSVDRVDNTKGYTKGNVRVISLRANRIKSDASLEELKQIVSYMEAHK